MYECPVQKMMSPFYDEVDAVHQRIAAQAVEWVRPLLAELSQSLPGRRLEYGDEIAPSRLPGVSITPPVIHEGDKLHLLEDVVEQAPETFRDPYRAKQIDDMLREAGIKMGDTFAGIGEVVHDPDQTIN